MKAEKCKIESVNGLEETERVVTECDVLNPTGTFQHMLCTDASQFSLGLYYRQPKKPILGKKKKKQSTNAAGVVSKATLPSRG